MVVFSGSFDPMTLGHVDLVVRSLAIFGRVVVAVAADTPKQTLFSVDERLALCEASLQDITLRTGQTLTVRPFSGMLTEFVQALNAVAVVRGVRGAADLAYERQMAQVNQYLAPSVETVFLPASPAYEMVSSSGAKEIARLGGPLHGFLATTVAAAVMAKMRQASPV